MAWQAEWRKERGRGRQRSRRREEEEEEGKGERRAGEGKGEEKQRGKKKLREAGVPWSASSLEIGRLSDPGLSAPLC